MTEKHFKIHSDLTIEKDRLESLQTEEMTYKNNKSNSHLLNSSNESL